MRILGDSQITNADITATNIISPALTAKLQTFQLTDNMRTIAPTTEIFFTFNGDVPDIDCVALCGTNLTPSAVVTLSYSDVDINSPDLSIVLPVFSTLNQVFFLDSPVNKKFWKIEISDPGNTILFFGYIYTGTYFQVPFVAYGHEPALVLNSNGSVSPTGQGYGSKIYNQFITDFTMYANYSDLETYLSIVQEKQNIDPVLIVEYEKSYDLSLYRPKYGILSNNSLPFPTSQLNYTYEIAGRHEERF